MSNTIDSERGTDAPSQGTLALDCCEQVVAAPVAPLTVLDLFAGIGGLSAGFHAEGFTVTGVDAEEIAAEVYEDAGFGKAHTIDLAAQTFSTDVTVLIGGPPCRPWSPVNLQRRGVKHRDHGLLTRFVQHIQVIEPLVFVMENVPALRSDASYIDGMHSLVEQGYDVKATILRYDHFGASTRRRRLFTLGVRTGQGAGIILEHLHALHRPACTVGDAIRRFRDTPRDGFPDHDWSELTSIGRYRDRYRTGQYGWRRLEYGKAAPSFGSVAKTYILHPEAGIDGFPERVLSVREVMAIAGFDDNVRFPAGTARARRYQMTANAVSPQVSRAVACAVKRFLSSYTPRTSG